MNPTILVLDTETTGLQKPFCYNLGYAIYDPAADKIVLERDYVVEQVWHNLPLFESAYYADKRPQYVTAMRTRKAVMDKYGYIMAQMIRDIRDCNVSGVYAFNSGFDDRVINFNCDYYHCKNPLDNVPVFDIRGYACTCFMSDTYRNFCDTHAEVKNAQGDYKFITDSDGYKTTAESFQCFLNYSPDFDEAHTALADCKIELNILKMCLQMGAKLGQNYPTEKSYPRKSHKPFKLSLFGEVTEGEAGAISVRKTKKGTYITIK